METDKTANVLGREMKARDGHSGGEGFAILESHPEGLFEKVTEQRSQGIGGAGML